MSLANLMVEVGTRHTGSHQFETTVLSFLLEEHVLDLIVKRNVYVYALVLFQYYDVKEHGKPYYMANLRERNIFLYEIWLKIIDNLKYHDKWSSEIMVQYMYLQMKGYDMVWYIWG